MSHVEDEDVDDFLYGDSSKNKSLRSGSADNAKESDISKKTVEEEEEDELYGLYREGADNEKEEFIVNDGQDQRDEDANEDAQSDTNGHEDSDDDDLEIILEADDAEQAADSSQSQANQDATGTQSLVNIKPNAGGKPIANTQQKQDGATGVAKPAAGGIDLDAVGQLDGKAITEVELDSFEDKPWRKPGADITDYFNYGFNEASWRAYCNKQKMLREGKGKMMGNMDMPPEMAMGMMMPPMMDGGMGGMPPNPMMGMPMQMSMGMPMNMPPGGINPNFRGGGRPNGLPPNQGSLGRSNNRGGMAMGRMRGSQEPGGGDDKSNASENGDDFNAEQQHMNFPMNFPGAPPMGMFPPDMGPMGGMPPFFNPNMAGPGGQVGFDGPGGPNRGNPMMMMRGGGGPMRPPRGRGSPVSGDLGGATNDPRKRMLPPEDDPYNKRPRTR